VLTEFAPTLVQFAMGVIVPVDEQKVLGTANLFEHIQAVLFTTEVETTQFGKVEQLALEIVH